MPAADRRCPDRSRITALENVRTCIRAVQRRLARAQLHFGHGTHDALEEAAWLVGACLGIKPADLERSLARTVQAAEQQKLWRLVEQRISTREPLAYLLHEAWFGGNRLYVDKDVLIPRSHLAEFVLEQFRPWIRAERVHRALDLCTGSGCIAIALAQNFPNTWVDATDLSPGALAVARRNVNAYGLTDRVRVVQSDFFDGLEGIRYDLIVTNPPYVSAGDMHSLPQEYRHEPVIALDGGVDGLDALRKILADAGAHLELDGILVAEAGNSATVLQKCFPQVPFTWLTTSTGDESVFLLTAEQLNQCRHWLSKH